MYSFTDVSVKIKSTYKSNTGLILLEIVSDFKSISSVNLIIQNKLIVQFTFLLLMVNNAMIPCTFHI